MADEPTTPRAYQGLVDALLGYTGVLRASNKDLVNMPGDVLQLGGRLLGHPRQQVHQRVREVAPWLPLSDVGDTPESATVAAWRELMQKR